MGKHKHREKGGGGGRGGYLEAYLSSVGSTTTVDQEGQDEPYPDSMRVSTLLEQIGKERSWDDEMIVSDIEICEKNRLFSLRDLRVISDESWKEIQLLPIVKDLLRIAVAQGMPTRKDLKRYKKHKEKKLKHYENDNQENPQSSQSSSQPPQSSADAQPVSILPNVVEYTSKKRAQISSVLSNPPPASPSPSSSSSSSSSESEPAPQKPTLTKAPVRRIQPISATRLRVTTPAGTTFECDRLCPHKNADLASWGTLLGNTLVCTKHNWSFNLEAGGRCRNGGGINACKVNDW